MTDADIMCLVECEASVFSAPDGPGSKPHGPGCLTRVLAGAYDAVFRKKVVGADHGSMVAWRRDRFRLVASCGVRFDDLGDAIESDGSAPSSGAGDAAAVSPGPAAASGADGGEATAPAGGARPEGGGWAKAGKGRGRGGASPASAGKGRGGGAGRGSTGGKAGARQRKPPSRAPLPGDALRRGNVGVMAALLPAGASPESPGVLVVVAACHLWWQPDQPHVNASQAVLQRMALERFAGAALAAAGPAASSAAVVLGGDTNRFPSDIAMRILRGDIAPAAAPEGAAAASAGTEAPAVMAVCLSDEAVEPEASPFALSLRASGSGGPGLALPFDSGTSSFLLRGVFGSARTPWPPQSPRAFGKEVPAVPEGARYPLFWEHDDSDEAAARRTQWLRALRLALVAHGLLPCPRVEPGEHRRRAGALVEAAVLAMAESGAAAAGMGRLDDAYERAALGGAWTAPLPMTLSPACGNVDGLLGALPAAVLRALGAPAKLRAGKPLQKWAEAAVALPLGLQLPPAPEGADAAAAVEAWCGEEDRALPEGEPPVLVAGLAPFAGRLPSGDAAELEAFAAAPGDAPDNASLVGGSFTNAVPEFSGWLDHVLLSGPLASDGDSGVRPSPSGGARLVGVAPLPDAEWAFGGLGGMPNSVQPSDHLPLMAVLRLA